MDSDVARHLIEARARLGLTQGEFAARVGVSQGAVSRWEKGRHRPNPEVLLRLRGLSGAPPEAQRAEAIGPLLPVQRLGAGRPRLRFRPIEEPQRRLSDLLEASLACAVRGGRGELADALRPILDRCLNADRAYLGGRRASDRSPELSAGGPWP